MRIKGTLDEIWMSLGNERIGVPVEVALSEDIFSILLELPDRTALIQIKVTNDKLIRVMLSHRESGKLINEVVLYEFSKENGFGSYDLRKEL